MPDKTDVLSSFKASSLLAVKPDHRVSTSSEQPRLPWVEFAIQNTCTLTKAKPFSQIMPCNI
jgi:hypothetical protein